MNETPQYTHDCDRCEFLGRFHHNGTDYDLYYADHGGLPGPDTVIARFGNDEWQYTSGFALCEQVPALAEAKRRHEAGNE